MATGAWFYAEICQIEEGKGIYVKSTQIKHS